MFRYNNTIDILLYKCLYGVVFNMLRILCGSPHVIFTLENWEHVKGFPVAILGEHSCASVICHSLHWDLARESTAAYAKNGLAGSTDTHCDSPNRVREGLVLSRALCSGFGAVIPLQLTPEWLKVHPQPSVFFFTYLRWFVWPNLGRVLIEDWKCITFPGKVSWEGVLETCHSESDCKSKGGCHMYEILEYSFYHFHKAYLTHKQNVHKHADCANQMAAGRANWHQKKAHA